MLAAWNKIGDVDFELNIIGDGPLKEWCFDYIKNENVNKVNMLGKLPREKTISLIAESRAIIVPSQWYEGFPMVIAEACAVETMIIGSNIGNVSNLIVEGKNGFAFQYDSIDDLSNVIRSSMKISNFQFEADPSVVEEDINYQMLLRIFQKIIGKEQ